MANNISVYLGLTLFISACANSPLENYKAESIAQKMQRYESRDVRVNKPPQISTPQIKWKGSRSPASAGSVPSFKSKISNKQLYFLTLASQYYEFQSFAGSTETEIKTCANFHSLLVDYGAKIKSHTKPLNIDLSFYQNVSKETHPEMYLPLSLESATPTLNDTITDSSNTAFQRNFKNAMKIHAKKTHDEISELCEFGRSDNYYIFANLVNHKQKQRWIPTKDASALLKSSIFNNKAILTSIKRKSRGRVPASSSVGYSKYLYSIVNDRLNSHWMDQYYAVIGK